MKFLKYLPKTKTVNMMLVIFAAGFIAGVLTGWIRGIPFLISEQKFSIGIYTGDSPFALKTFNDTDNPVLTWKDVTDVKADFVADPFMVNHDGTWFMFFEVYNSNDQQGDIGLAFSKDGFNWDYSQIVLDEPHHLSYPYVFRYKDDYYMIPESHAVYAVQLYKALDFPTKWLLIKNLIRGNYSDSSIFEYNKKWWIFCSDRNDILHLFWANDLMGPWNEHPRSPVILGNGDIARPGGRVLLINGRVFRITQDCYPTYGYQVRAFEIVELTERTYKENTIPENPILKPGGNGWNAEGMHHVDAHLIEKNRWLACVDGIGLYWKFGFQY